MSEINTDVFSKALSAQSKNYIEQNISLSDKMKKRMSGELSLIAERKERELFDLQNADITDKFSWNDNDLEKKGFQKDGDLYSKSIDGYQIMIDKENQMIHQLPFGTYMKQDVSLPHGLAITKTSSNKHVGTYDNNGSLVRKCLEISPDNQKATLCEFSLDGSEKKISVKDVTNDNRFIKGGNKNFFQSKLLQQNANNNQLGSVCS